MSKWNKTLSYDASAMFAWVKVGIEKVVFKARDIVMANEIQLQMHFFFSWVPVE